jgi:hypothetical protein
MAKQISKSIVSVLAGVLPLLAQQKFAVTMHHYDTLRTGWNSQEFVLNPSFQNRRRPAVSDPFGLVAKVALDDTVYAQPLIVPDVTINGGKHDVVYVATENNTVYASDANNGLILKTRNLGKAVPRPGACENNGPRVGIEPTPAIDVPGWDRVPGRSDPQPTYRIHAINLNGLER